MDKKGVFVLLTVALCFTSAITARSAENLDDAWREALAASRALQAENDRIASSQYKREAVTQARVPKVTGESSYTTMSEHIIAEVDVSSMTGSRATLDVPVLDKNFGTTSASVSAPIYLGGKLAALESAQDNLTEAANHQRRGTVAQLRYDVARAYFTVQLCEKLHEVATAAKEALDSRLRDTQNLLDQGMTTRSAYLSVKVAQANAQQTVYETQFALDTARAAYNRLLWRPLDSPVELEEIPLPKEERQVDALIADAIQNRPELAQLQAQSRALSSKSESLRAERRPQVVAVGSYGYMQNQTLNTNDVAQASVAMTWTPFDGGSRAQERATQREAAAVMHMREELANAVKLQVQKAWNDVQSARSKIDVALEAVEQANENQKLVAEQFQEGVATYTEALDSQTLWTKAYSNLYGAYYNALIAHYALEFVVGNL